jgi:hypothetical protein
MEPRNFDMTVRVMGQTYQFSTRDELSIDRNDLDSELAYQAARYAWVATLHEQSKAEKARANAKYEAMAGQIEEEIRSQYEGTKGKPTEGAIKAKVKIDPRLDEISKLIDDISENERLTAILVSAFVQRKDLVVTLAKSRNFEMSSMSADEINRIKSNLLGRP